MKKILPVIIVVIIVLLGVVVLQRIQKNGLPNMQSGEGQETPGQATTTEQTATTTPTQDPNFDESISDGTIAFSFPKADFGLAVSPEQILVKSYIPPCNDFDYCLYYDGTAYKGTNFESAGVGIKRRNDLTTESLCLNTPPDGYATSTMPSSKTIYDTYAISVFSNIGDAGAGHYSIGDINRLFVRKNALCYSIETRIGETQFANYPPGSIQQFTTADEATMKEKLQEVLHGIHLVGALGVPF